MALIKILRGLFARVYQPNIKIMMSFLKRMTELCGVILLLLGLCWWHIVRHWLLNLHIWWPWLVHCTKFTRETDSRVAPRLQLWWDS